MFWLCAPGRVAASPNVDVDDPVYERLARLYAEGRLEPYLGGLRPLTNARVRSLLRAGGESKLGDEPNGWWISPVRRARLRFTLARDRSRSYSTTGRPRQITGGLQLSCEREQGRACGKGIGAESELETAAGHGDLLAVSVRLRAGTGTSDRTTELVLDRSYVSLETKPILVELGRDVLALGPSSRTQLAWSTHAPPADFVRVSTAHPWMFGSHVRVSGHYVVGRLRDPQTFPGNVVTLARGQLDTTGGLELGVVQMLQLGGEGAPPLGVLGFLLEHVRRGDKTGGAQDSSNRRFGFDMSARIDELRGLRMYYALMFEDVRRARFFDAVRYDADHLVGLELAALREHALTFEWHRTGVRSQEHSARMTGFTNAGYAVGSPLGPDSDSLYVGGRVALDDMTLRPWIERTSHRSDMYVFVEDGPINRTAPGTEEQRYRAGLSARYDVSLRLSLDVNASLERTNNFGFDAGVGRTNAAVIVGMSWSPYAK